MRRALWLETAGASAIEYAVVACGVTCVCIAGAELLGGELAESARMAACRVASLPDGVSRCGETKRAATDGVPLDTETASAAAAQAAHAASADANGASMAEKLLAAYEKTLAETAAGGVSSSFASRAEEHQLASVDEDTLPFVPDPSVEVAASAGVGNGPARPPRHLIEQFLGGRRRAIGLLLQTITSWVVGDAFFNGAGDFVDGAFPDNTQDKRWGKTSETIPPEDPTSVRETFDVQAEPRPFADEGFTSPETPQTEEGGHPDLIERDIDTSILTSRDPTDADRSAAGEVNGEGEATSGLAGLVAALGRLERQAEDVDLDSSDAVEALSQELAGVLMDYGHNASLESIGDDAATVVAIGQNYQIDLRQREDFRADREGPVISLGFLRTIASAILKTEAMPDLVETLEELKAAAAPDVAVLQWYQSFGQVGLNAPEGVKERFNDRVAEMAAALSLQFDKVSTESRGDDSLSVIRIGELFVDPLQVDDIHRVDEIHRESAAVPVTVSLEAFIKALSSTPPITFLINVGWGVGEDLAAQAIATSGWQVSRRHLYSLRGPDRELLLGILPGSVSRADAQLLYESLRPGSFIEFDELKNLLSRVHADATFRSSLVEQVFASLTSGMPERSLRDRGWDFAWVLGGQAVAPGVMGKLVVHPPRLRHAKPGFSFGYVTGIPYDPQYEAHVIAFYVLHEEAFAFGTNGLIGFSILPGDGALVPVFGVTVQHPWIARLMPRVAERWIEKMASELARATNDVASAFRAWIEKMASELARATKDVASAFRAWIDRLVRRGAKHWTWTELARVINDVAPAFPGFPKILGLEDGQWLDWPESVETLKEQLAREKEELRALKERRGEE